MALYEAVKGYGDTITCDGCNDITENWFTGESRAICQHCYSQEPISWGELAELTHALQVERFGFCGCEDNEGGENPFSDCPKVGSNGEALTLNESGRYIDGAGRFGYNSHFGGAWVCYRCGHLCDCEGDN